ncbi:PREDICTED: tyrosine-protein phosphatase non-receptor type 22 [Nanorana parkeri]|uniref:tyrosine-protein phosphatase non-receptor type 22 n=1 Tax=Nanorana parkeri TaxID=125878 RepID=UPI000853F495|nr:PREDICTED: tyrosine-protein phosphatase non-receptor type 22 [Nanorana parkeri]
MEQREVLQRYLDGYLRKKENTDGFANDFMNLKRQSAKHKSDSNYTTKAAESAENFKKNRYKDILPFDHSRVKLSLITSDEDTDFINANFIKGVYCPRAYIGTQGPLPSTVVDFWRMIWEYNVGIIVMACMEFEMGKKKCERYWVEAGCEVLQCGPFLITCSNEDKRKDYVIRTLIATYGSDIRIVHQFHYKNWPDHDVPSSCDHILGMIEDIRALQRDDNPPICVHCSAGCGRTGVICAIDYIWRLMKDEIIPVNFSVYTIIQEMRTQRSSLVQTKEQYELVFNAVIHLFKKELHRLNGTSDVEQTNLFGNVSCLADAHKNLARLSGGYTGECTMEEEIDHSSNLQPLQRVEVPPLNDLNITVTSLQANAKSPPPLPERTPESFIVPGELNESPQELPQLQPKMQVKVPSVKIGKSQEWAGVYQYNVGDFRLKARSKSVKVRGSRMEKTRDRSASPPPIPERTEDSYIVADGATNTEYNVSDHPRPALPTDVTSSVSSPEPTKQITRKKSLKILKNVKKNVCSLAKSDSDSSQSGGPLSFLNFGFGNRFAKPKGPRNPPPTWNM